MNEPIKMSVEVKAEDAHQYPDMRLKLLIRKAVQDATKYDMTIDTAATILQEEADYLANTIRKAVASNGR